MDTGGEIKVGGFRDSELQLVVFQVLTVPVSVEAQLSVGYKFLLTPPTSCSLTRCDLADDTGICSPSEVDSVYVVVAILQLVEELDGDGALKWPLQVIVKVTLH